jgi:polar amino acid transport system substrate-binding protein
VKRFEDNNATVSAFVSGQVQVIATGASVAGNMMARNPQLGTEFKLLLKDSPNFIGVAKGDDKLRSEGQRDHRGGQGQRRDRQRCA